MNRNTPIYICVKAASILRQPLLFFSVLILSLNSHGISNMTQDYPTMDSVINLDRPNLKVLQNSILQSINKFRLKNNVKSLKWSDTLFESSKYHLNQMNARKFFDHSDPSDKNYPDLKKRVSKFSNQFNCLSENLIQYFPFKFKGQTIEFNILKVKNGYIYTDPTTKKPLKVLTYSQLADQIVNNWASSPHHRQNMLDIKSDRIGMAIYFPKYYHEPNISPITVVANFGGCLKK